MKTLSEQIANMAKNMQKNMSNASLKMQITDDFTELFNLRGASLLDNPSDFDKHFEPYFKRWEGERWEFEEFIGDLFNGIPNRLK